MASSPPPPEASKAPSPPPPVASSSSSSSVSSLDGACSTAPGCVGADCRPAPFDSDELAARERDAVDYDNSRITMQMARDGTAPRKVRKREGKVIACFQRILWGMLEMSMFRIVIEIYFSDLAKAEMII